MHYRSKKLLDSARGKPCCACGDDNGTTVAAHLNSVAHGKGTGIKCPDYFHARLCNLCHALYDGRIGRLTKEEKGELWTRAYLRTVEAWFLEGVNKC